MIAIEQYSGYTWWLKKRKKYYRKNTMMIFLIVLIFSVALWVANKDNIEIMEFIFVTVFMLLFICVGVQQARRWLACNTLIIDNYHIGTVVSMRRNLKPNKKVKNYRITANVNGKELEGLCLLQTYGQVQPGDQVLVFCIGDMIYCVQPYV